MQQPIRILIVEDDKDWLRGLTAYLSAEPDLEICAVADTSEQSATSVRAP